MRFDGLGQPLSDDDPAGPDLDDEIDSEYINYVLSADSRMPERYFTLTATGQYVQFDATAIDLAAEMRAIEKLLGRSRDIRLVALDARFNILTGNIIGFSEALQGMATIVANLWPSFHPRAQDGDYIQRQNVVDGLDDQPRVIQPLQHANIAGGTRARAVSYRNYLVTSGKVEPRDDEERVPLDDISRTLSGLNQRGEPVDELRERVELVYHAVQAALGAIETMRQTFAANVASEYVPGLTALPETLRGIAELITTYRRDLLPGGGEEEGEDAAGEGEDEEGERSAGRPVGAIRDQAAARRALAAVERYLLFNEPSSPALILVHQSRLLVGRPLVEALAALMPDMSERAALRFDAGLRFDIDISRMRTVTEDALAEHQAELEAAAARELEEPAETDGSAHSDETADSNGGSSEEPASDAGPTEAETAESGSTDAGEASADGAGDGEPAASGEAEGADPSPDDPAPAADAAPPAPAPPAPPPPAPRRFVATTRAQAADLISGTEAFFRVVEPSSPLPTLLSRARGYLNRDFASILNDLMPREDED